LKSGGRNRGRGGKGKDEPCTMKKGKGRIPRLRGGSRGLKITGEKNGAKGRKVMRGLNGGGCIIHSKKEELTD